MPKRTRDYRESLLERLRDDPEEAAQYLNAAMEDSSEMLLVALRNVAEAQQKSNGTVQTNEPVPRERRPNPPQTGGNESDQ